MMSRKNTNSASLIKISTFIMLLAALAAVVVVQGAAPFMVEVLAGANFEPAVGILRLLILAAIFSYMGHLVGFDLIARGGQKEMLKIGGVALIFNFGLNVILIPRYGVTAAALVTVMTELLDMGLMAYFLGKYKASSIN